MMREEEIIEILTKTGCLSNQESDADTAQQQTRALQPMRLLSDPIVTNRLAVELLQKLPEGTKFDKVLCLHEDEMLFAYSVATAAWAQFVVAEVTEEGKVVFLHGNDVVENDKVLIVDDVLDNSSHIAELKQEVISRKAEIVGISTLATFKDTAEEGIAVYSLLAY